MHRLLWFGAAILLALGLVAPASAAGDGITAATAVGLPASLSATTTITGSAGGAFAYYTFTSPGAASAATLAVTITPASAATATGTGVNLYQAGSLLVSSNASNPSPSGAATSLPFGVAAGPVLVQVYNYLAGQSATISFAISGIGTAGPPASESSSPATPVPSTPSPVASAQPAGFVVASPSSLLAWGSIEGSSGGAFRYYTFNAPANRATGTITLVVSPRDPNTNRAVGINLLQDDATLASINTASAVPGVNSAGFPLTTAGPMRVQVYDYLPGETADYTIVVSGPGLTP